ncbi:MAG: hypothetical protein ABWY64_04175 [Tardiphaga sp.]
MPIKKPGRPLGRPFAVDIAGERLKRPPRIAASFENSGNPAVALTARRRQHRPVIQLLCVGVRDVLTEAGYPGAGPHRNTIGIVRVARCIVSTAAFACTTSIGTEYCLFARFWHKADIAPHLPDVRFLGV